MPDGIVDRLAQLTLFGDLRWPELEAVAHTFEEIFYQITRHPSTFRIKSGVDKNGKKILQDPLPALAADHPDEIANTLAACGR